MEAAPTWSFTLAFRLRLRLVFVRGDLDTLPLLSYNFLLFRLRCAIVRLSKGKLAFEACLNMDVAPST
jgi:hypothetical protein